MFRKNILLSILICTIPERKESYEKLKDRLNRLWARSFGKSGTPRFEIISQIGDMTVGAKRNKLISLAGGKYVCFIDDDDDVTDEYILRMIEGCQSNADCVGMVGIITFSGKNPRKFIHSIKYNRYFEENEVYYRPPNHLNAIKKELIADIKFPEKNNGEDTDWAMQVMKSGRLKIEYEVNEVLYHYLFDSEKTATQK